ncbi:MAG: ABC transporter permease [Clostridia bacterium]|nr:ABC transporter permease [Clostridia bacterium]
MKKDELALYESYNVTSEKVADENAVVDLEYLETPQEELFAHQDHNDLESEKITAPRYSYWKSVFRVFFKKKINIFFLALLGLIIVIAYIYPLIIGYDAKVTPFINITDHSAWNLSASDAISKYGFGLHWILGTGEFGQSTFDYIWYGSSISLSLAFICAAINMIIGVVIGAIWGYSKKVDIFMTELYNIVGNVPYVLIISVLILVLTASFWTMVFALTITGWLGIAYFIRTQVIIIRDREYNLASRCLGTNIIRISLKNILPFMTSVIVMLLATEIPSYISMEVFLSFIGIGMSDMSLGKIIQEAQKSMLVEGRQIQFWAPVVVSAIITIVLYVVGQNLGDASDPRTHM